MSKGRAAAATLAALVILIAVLAVFVARHRSRKPAPAAPARVTVASPELLPTGMTISPLAPRGARFFPLEPHLRDFPDFVAGQPVTLALAPDGKTLLLLTSGYNRNNGPDGRRVRDASNEYVFVYDVAHLSPRPIEVLQVPNTFDGIAWNPAGTAFYVSGGGDDDIHVFERSAGLWREAGTPIPLGHRRGLGIETKPVTAGLAVTADGRRLLAANFENDSVSLVDLGQRRAIAEVDLRPGKIDPRKRGVPGGEYPFWIVIRGSSRAWVSCPRDRQVVVLDLSSALRVAGRIALPGQPNRMILNHDGSRLFASLGTNDTVAEIDTGADRVIGEISTTAPHSIFPNPRALKGSNPNGLVLSPDEKTLYVTNGGANSVAVISLAASPAESSGADVPRERIEGLIPTAWYPDSISVSPDGGMLYVANTRSDPGPNPSGCRTNTALSSSSQAGCRSANQYILQLSKGGLWAIPTPDSAELASLTEQVARNDHYRAGARPSAAEETMAVLRRRIRHVIYIVKENRTYDQVLGDLPEGNGDPRLTLFPEPITPNLHRLAADFVDLDNLYASGEVSGDGWNWSTAARASELVENNVPLEYAGRGLSFDFQGIDRNINVGFATLAGRRAANPDTPADPDLLPGAADVGAPDGPGGQAGAGYLWDAALRAHLTLRNYGCFSDLHRYSLKPSNPGYIPPIRNPFAASTRVDFPAKAALMAATDPYYRSFDQAFPDYWRYQEWNREFQLFVRRHDLPALEMLWVPHDHFGSFATAIDGVNTVETEIADNDYAIGMIVQQVAHSPYRDDTLIFIIEDDAQNGPDHVDAHRTVGYVIGPYVKQHAVVSTHYTTVNMVRTIEGVLGIGPMGINDAVLSPMADAFTTKLEPWSYAAVVPAALRATKLPLPPSSSAGKAAAGENPAYARPLHSAVYWAAATRGLDFAIEDHLDSARFNRILWEGLMGPAAPYPTSRNGLDLRRQRRRLLEQYAPGARSPVPRDGGRRR
ncbi:MAG TPA: hypothetical protein VGS20_16620 [Candidatus Acidoferrales bacterium]|nr:hypothetical protein [Candidatus Acidoferrales bacterium]